MDLDITHLPVPFLDEAEAKAEAKGRAEGHAEGRAESLLDILKKRGFTVPEKRKAEVGSCTDEEQLRTWIDLSLDAKTLGDVFGPDDDQD